jgi:hypothetical protein
MAEESQGSARRTGRARRPPGVSGHAGLRSDAETPLGALSRAWKAEAEQLRERYGLEHLARLCERHLRELQEALRREAETVPTLEQAAAYSGYSTSHLRALQATGQLTQAGRKGSPRFLRGELRRRPIPVQDPAPAPAGPKGRKFDPDAVARSVLRTL